MVMFGEIFNKVLYENDFGKTRHFIKKFDHNRR